jgi:hypothetical protein
MRGFWVEHESGYWVSIPKSELDLKERRETDPSFETESEAVAPVYKKRTMADRNCMKKLIRKRMEDSPCKATISKKNLAKEVKMAMGGGIGLVDLRKHGIKWLRTFLPGRRKVRGVHGSGDCSGSVRLVTFPLGVKRGYRFGRATGGP